MSDSSSDCNPLDAIADEFVQRYHRGERPALSEYADKYPNLADEIRELFPALVLMQEVRPEPGNATGPYQSHHAEAASKRPERLGDYRILREVGRGGMGVVYEAEQESLGRHVALKVLPSHSLLNPTYLERFRREARAAARLHHTNIVPVFGVGECEGVHFYAMQFIRGEALDRVLNDLRRIRAKTEVSESEGSVAFSLLNGNFAAPTGPEQKPSQLPRPYLGMNEDGDSGRETQGSATGLSASSRSGADYNRSVARVGLQVAEALAYAHKQGVLPRDIKPSNLLLDLQGTVWITDFGLAKAEGSGELTQLGDIVGTIRFMAPERFDGQSLPQSDLYSLGLTLYEMLALRPAFDDTNRARLIERVLHEPPAAPRKVEPHIPRDLETVVLKCVAKDPNDRYLTADALAEDLRRYLADRPIKARRISIAEQVWRWCRRNPVVAGLAGTVLALLLMMAAGSSVSAVWLKEQRDVARDLVSELRDERIKTLGHLLDSYLGQARAGRWSGRVGRRFESLRALKEAAQLARQLGWPEERLRELRNEAIACLALPDICYERQLTCPTSWIALDLQFAHYAFADKEGNVHVGRVVDSGEIGVIQGPGPGRPLWYYLNFSPDGQWLAVTDEPRQTLELWEVRPNGLSRLERVEPAMGLLGKDGISRDGRHLAVTCRDHSPGVYDRATGRLTPLRAGGQPGQAAFNPDGKHLAVSVQSAVHVFDWATGREVVTLEQPSPVDEISWCAGGELLAVSGNTDLLIRVWDWRNRKLVTVLEGHQSASIALWGLRHTYGLLWSRSWDGTARLWDAVHGKQLLSVQGHLVAICGDECRLALVNGDRVEVHSIASGTECRALHHSFVKTHWTFSADFSPDGRWLATAGVNGVRLWDAACGTPAATLPLGRCSVSLQPRGESLVTCGDLGIHRWPLASRDQQPATHLAVGPPQLLASAATYENRVGWSHDGLWLGIVQAGRAVVQNMVQPAQRYVLGPHPGLRHVALSPDGRWAATSTWGGRDVKIWEVATKSQVVNVPGGNGFAQFSADSRWLATTVATEGSKLLCQVWQVGTWQPGASVAIGVDRYSLAFSPDSRVLALCKASSTISLIEVATGRELAVLEAPHVAPISWLAFSPDGGRLAMAHLDHTTYLWDLRSIRRQLAEMGLDLDLPPYPPALESEPRPLRVNVDLGDLPQQIMAADPKRALAVYSLALALQPINPEAYYRRGLAHGKLRDSPKAIADYSLALALMPAGDKRRPDILVRRAANYGALKDDARALSDLEQLVKLDLGGVSELHPAIAQMFNNQAWQKVTGPAGERDPARMLPLVRKAVELTPEEAIYWNSLGVVQYRLGRFQEAVVSLEKSLSLGTGQADAFDLFFLAMCHVELGDAGKARECFDRAVKWTESQKDLPPHYVEELKAFRTEAEAVLKQK